MNDILKFASWKRKKFVLQVVSMMITGKEKILLKDAIIIRVKKQSYLNLLFRDGCERFAESLFFAQQKKTRTESRECQDPVNLFPFSASAVIE